MKITILILAIFLTACAGEPMSTQDTNALMATRAIATSTTTRVPAPTIDYVATIVVSGTQAEAEKQNAYAAQQAAINAQETSAAAMVALVELTAQHEVEQIAQMQATQAAESISLQATQQIQSWTATAALTSIPATMTQQAVNNTQIPAQQRIMSTSQAMTIVAPTVVAAILDDQDRAKYGWVNYLMIALLSLTAIALMVYVILFINHNLKVTEQAEAQEAILENLNDAPFIQPTETETVIQIKQDHGQGMYHTERFVVPCSPTQLTELATEVLAGDKTLAFNKWERADSAFTPQVFERTRHWAQINQFVLSVGQGRVSVTDKFTDILRQWVEKNTLPTEYHFEEMENAT